MAASKRENRVVYGAAVVQGIVLVTFPAASTIFTDPDEYDLSNTQYGLLFLPQVVTAIAASLLGARLARRVGTKRVYLMGLTAGLVSMGLLMISRAFEGDGDGRPRRLRTIDRWVPERLAYRLLPFVLAGTFALIALLPDDTPGLGVLAFGLAGSAALRSSRSRSASPRRSSLRSQPRPHHRVLPARIRIAAFGVGRLLVAGVSLPAVYAAAAGIAVAMGLLSTRVVRRRQPVPH
jgi:MFS family permease